MQDTKSLAIPYTQLYVTKKGRCLFFPSLASNTIALHPQREREFPSLIHSLKGFFFRLFNDSPIEVVDRRAPSVLDTGALWL
uniref:Uncharacterized protein n=1 Tax=Salix viminalis TaxID=40686 RepID=A0A6N2M549_SALVM